MDPETERSLRAYANAEASWRQLQWEHGFDTYYEVLAGLGELGLRPPIVPMTGPKAEATRARLRAHLDSLTRREYTPAEWPPEVQAATRQFIADEEVRRKRREHDDAEDLNDVLASGDRIATRDAEALRLLAD